MRPLHPALLLAAFLASHAAADPLHLLFVGDDGGSAWRGVQLGVAEANILGEFTGQTWTVEALAESTSQQDSNTARATLAVFTDHRDSNLRRLADHFEGIPVLNLVDNQDDLRTGCLPNLLHMIPSHRMKEAAVVQWLGQHPGKPSLHLRALAWHSDFVKFAARDLNKRYRKAHGEAMTAEAWSGWVAVKLVIEAVTRSNASSPQALLATLHDGFEIDGQKGVPLSLRPTGQLRQPLLLVDGDQLLGEAPVRGAADVEDLDSLGLLSCSTAENFR